MKPFFLTSALTSTLFAVALSGALSSAPASAQTAVSDLQAPEARIGETAEIDGATIFYEVAGDGPALMLLHGYPLSGALFARVRDELDDDFTVVTLDHRGYGLSRAPDVPSDVATYAQDALALMDRLGIDQAAIGGMSMGGPIVLEMYARAPERFSSMILIDTIASAASPAEAGIWRGVQTMVERGGVEAIVPFLMPQMLTGETRMNEPEQAEYLTRVMKGATKDAAMGGAIALESRPDLSNVLETIEVPTLVLVGRADPVYAYEVSLKMVETIGDAAEAAIVPGASHAAIFERPVASAEAIRRFLSR